MADWFTVSGSSDLETWARENAFAAVARLGVERTDSWRVTSGRWQMGDQVPPHIQECSQPLCSHRRELRKSLALKEGFLWARFLEINVNLLLPAKYVGIMNSSSYLGKSLSRNPFSLKEKIIHPNGSGCAYFGDSVWNAGRNVWCWDVWWATRSKLFTQHNRWWFLTDMYGAIKMTKYITGRKVGCEEAPQQLKKEKSA